MAYGGSAAEAAAARARRQQRSRQQAAMPCCLTAKQIHGKVPSAFGQLKGDCKAGERWLRSSYSTPAGGTLRMRALQAAVVSSPELKRCRPHTLQRGVNGCLLHVVDGQRPILQLCVQHSHQVVCSEGGAATQGGAGGRRPGCARRRCPVHFPAPARLPLGLQFSGPPRRPQNLPLIDSLAAELLVA